MNKREVQKRVLQSGKPLALCKFNWNKHTKTFSTTENNLVIDFLGIHGCIFTTGSGCIFTTGSGCIFTTGSSCIFTTGSDCTFKTSWDCTFITGSGCIFTTGSSCTFKTSSYCTFISGFNCTFTTDWNCTFTTGSNCTFTTGSDCTFITGSNCTFTTASHCTFKTGACCTFKIGMNCVISRHDTLEIIKTTTCKSITLCPHNVHGYIENGKHSVTGKPSIVADGILSEIVSKKQSRNIMVYKVINHGSNEKTYLIESGGAYSHGKTLKEAKENFKYKISDRDTSKYKSLTTDSIITNTEAIKLYITIAGACEEGVRYFVNNLKKVPKKLSIKELIKLTKGQYNHSLLVDFFKYDDK